MAGFGGVKDLRHVWTLSARESGDPASCLAKGKRHKGGVNEGENPKD
jgi:hypothetical protein